MLTSTALMTRFPQLNSVKHSVNISEELLPYKHSWGLNAQQHDKQPHETKEEVTRLIYNTPVCLYVCLSNWLAGWTTDTLSVWLSVFP
jgi:hypothetical protein